MKRLCAFLLSMALCAAVPAATLRSLTLSEAGPGAARLTLSFDSPVQQRLLRLDNPGRLVIDLPQTRLAAGLRLPAATGPVQSLRSGVQPGQTLRLVLQVPLGLTVREQSSRLPGAGQQLLLELGPVTASTSPAAPAAAVALPVSPVAAPATQRPSGRDVIIAVDAGHGGQDPGASGPSGLLEKDAVLAIARALAQRLNQEPGFKAYLTRDSDRFLVLRDRIDKAREARADLFVSVHADSIANPDVAGSSVYVLSERGASNEAARWLAERENAADLKGGVSLGDKNAPLARVLMDLSQSASIGSSMEAAERVLAALDQVGEVRKSQVQQAGFVVLKSPDIPSMLVETAYISNPNEEKLLRTNKHRDEIAAAIFTGLRDYFRRNPPDGSLLAQQKQR
jgi:N-acetylmuramoyl-L-alanine amidase